MKYSGLMTADEVTGFSADFYGFEPEITKAVKVEIKPRIKHSDFLVTLKPQIVAEKLLEASFYNGMLNRWGWDKKFKKVH